MGCRRRKPQRFSGLLFLALFVFCGGLGASESPSDSSTESFYGVWSQVESAETRAVPVEPAETRAVQVEITTEYWSQVHGDRLVWRAPILRREGDVLELSRRYRRQARRLVVDGDRLQVTYLAQASSQTPEGQEVVEHYVRAKDRPAAFDLDPVPLGPEHEQPSAEELAELRRELLRRREEDQKVRQVFDGGRRPSPEAVDRVVAVDRSNTEFLLGMLARYGWIDRRRFGAEASEAAWLIVQHSDHLPLMLTVLPKIEEEVRRKEAKGSQYALLYDRTMLRIGQKQRYGSQLSRGPEGFFVSPLEDPEGVDARRSELGMGPLEDYLEFFQKQNEGRPIQIRREF